MQKAYAQGFFHSRRPIKLLLDPLLDYQREELYFLNRQWNNNFLVDTKMCVCSNKSCIRCWVSCHKFSDTVMTIFSGQSVEFTRHVLVTVRIAWNPSRGGTKKVLGTRYGTQWKTPQKWTVLNRTLPYHAVEKCHLDTVTHRCIAQTTLHRDV